MTHKFQNSVPLTLICSLETSFPCLLFSSFIQPKESRYHYSDNSLVAFLGRTVTYQGKSSIKTWELNLVEW